MNLELLRNVEQSYYPEHNEGVLDCGSEALTCAFNRRGTQLAVGCNDGRIAIWDFTTRCISRTCSYHIHPITSLSWNRNGTKLLSASTDWNVLLWDIPSGEIDIKFRFQSPILKVQFHPRRSDMFLVCPMKSAPIIVRKKKESQDYSHSPIPTYGELELNVVASFDRRGDRIVTGSSRGKLLVFDTTEEMALVCTIKLVGTAIKSIEFARRGSNFLVNSADRIVRVFDMDSIVETKVEDEMEPLQKLQDLVNRTQWKKCMFSGDAQYIVAGSYRQHELYIWDKATGSLVKMLTGQKGETLLDIAWHPVRPIIVSISNGLVNVWSQAAMELWSAYAPNFKELDENEEYEEKEGEFDIEDEDALLNKVLEKNKEDNVDVEVCEPFPIPAYCSSDGEETDALDWLPGAPEIEDPEEPGWGQLEPALNEVPVGSSSRKRAAGSASAVPPEPKIPKTVVEIDNKRCLHTSKDGEPVEDDEDEEEEPEAELEIASSEDEGKAADVSSEGEDDEEVERRKEVESSDQETEEPEPSDSETD